MYRQNITDCIKWQSGWHDSIFALYHILRDPQKRKYQRKPVTISVRTYLRKYGGMRNMSYEIACISLGDSSKVSMINGYYNVYYGWLTYWLAYKGRLDIIIKLPIHQTKVEYIFDGACKGKQIHILRFLRQGYTPAYDLSPHTHKIQNIFIGLCKQDKYYNVIQYLIRCMTNTNDVFEHALRTASKYGNLRIVKLLIKRGANINCGEYTANTDRKPPICVAAYNNRIHVVRYLIKKDANISLYDNYALEVACELGHEEIVKLLVNAGADTNTNYGAPIRYAMMNARIPIVDYLIDKGADIHCKNEILLKIAIENGYYALTRKLLYRGADMVVLCKHHPEAIKDMTEKIKTFMFIQEYMRNIR